MKSWQRMKFPPEGGSPNMFGRGTPMPRGKEKGKKIDKEDPVIKPSINMMGQMLENEQPTGAQSRENIRKGNV